MPSPFPGMNPYLERPNIWRDFHNTYIPALRAELQPRLVPKHYAQIQVHSYRTEWIGDDLEIMDDSKRDNTLEERYCYLEIIDLESENIVTVIELITPTLKIGKVNRERYLVKRRRLLDRGVNIVELDLLRAGKRLSYFVLPQCDYYAMVCRADQHPEAAIWPVNLHSSLPVIPIPLTPADRAVKMDLQPVFHRIYEGAGYANHIYRHRIVPPLTPADAAWAAEILTSAGITAPQ